MLPINITDLIEQRTIEGNRIEYKEGWNPERALHTICAFANDYENVGGGYLVIGISENNGRPEEVVGLSDESILKIENELFQLCNLIEPRYIPSFFESEYNDKKLILIWAPGNDDRPFKCPVLIGHKKKDSSEKVFYIRRMSHTVQATREEELHLFTLSGRISFDDSPNDDATIDDLRDSLLREYLAEVGSDLRNADKPTIVRSMRLMKGPPESQRPVNVGLMMFSDDPERFFHYARIEVVYKPDPTGEGMTENIFRGPIPTQIRNALNFIRSTFIREKIFKLPDQAEAVRVFSYPYNAVEEILVNAVYHKSYRIGEPVTVTITPGYMEVLSLPGPDRSISDDAISKFDMRSAFNRNKRLGEFLKELKLTEGRNTGIPKALRSLRDNGSEPPVFETDPGRTYLRVTIPVHEKFHTVPSADILPRTGRRTKEELKKLITEILRTEGSLTTHELSSALGYTSITGLMRRCISELIEEGIICYAYPENPRDPRQRLCYVK